jgi:hypothetical protein
MKSMHVVRSTWLARLWVGEREAECDATPPNNTMQLSIWLVTPRACARGAPSHLAADRER